MLILAFDLEFQLETVTKSREYRGKQIKLATT